MQDVIALMNQYALAVVFANVLLEQGGFPLPAYPTLLLAGALSAGKEHSAVMLLAAGVVGAGIADSLWYLAGRSFGTSVLGLLCRISLTPDTCVRQTTQTFDRYGAPSLLVAKFVPGFAAIAAALSGVVGIRYRRFLLFDTLGATIWVGVGIGLGYLLRSVIDDVLRWVAMFGRWAIVIGMAVLVAYLISKWLQRRRIARELQMDRISVEQLRGRMRGGNPPVIFDVRLPAVQGATGRIPGARLIHADRIDEAVVGLPPSSEMVVYCSCPNEASAVTVARALRARGFRSVLPLRGGIDAWTAAGLPVEHG